MKKIFMFIVIGLASVHTSLGARINQGTGEFALAGSFDVETENDARFSLSSGLGYFVVDGVEVGVKAHVFNDDLTTLWGFGGFWEYNFEQGTEFVPFVGAGLNLVHAEFLAGVRDTDKTSLVLDLIAGAKYFLTPQVAVSGQGTLSLAHENIYLEDDEVNDVDVRLELGLRFFF